GGYGSATVAREVTCRLWSGGRMGSPLSIMGAGKAAERGELLPCPCGHGARNSAAVAHLPVRLNLACFAPDDEQRDHQEYASQQPDVRASGHQDNRNDQEHAVADYENPATDRHCSGSVSPPLCADEACVSEVVWVVFRRRCTRCT